ncbi:MAG: rod shape-determining protein MreC [Kiritimatiellae bacterium]|nr:rod shape-determining protein MreC [Kiritimatiellia bacterium]MDD4025565.1 rod shape-determining protein MreC [Kiritimatiellia bacterium]MDD4622017.1 rod shape-determining protein MreC [Kiritimatiellia bacterium]
MKQAKFWIWLFVLTLAALASWQAGVRDFAREAVYPYENAKVWFDRTVGVRVKAVFNRVSHASRNAMLERDVSRLRILAAENEALEADVARLRSVLDFTPAVDCRWIAAPVLSRGGTIAVWQSMRVAKGSLHGVRKGDPVVVPDGVVGRVADISPHTSEVMLITDPNSRVSCELETPGAEVGAVRGILYGGGTRPAADPQLTLLYVIEPLRLRYLERDFEPPPRTRVVTSGLGQAFPRGLTVGYLLESSMERNGLAREAEIMPAADLASADEVFILSVSRGDHAR